jgi:hypothetical protein
MDTSNFDTQFTSEVPLDLTLLPHFFLFLSFSQVILSLKSQGDARACCCGLLFCTHLYFLTDTLLLWLLLL